jgi:hypothetical protein
MATCRSTTQVAHLAGPFSNPSDTKDDAMKKLLLGALTTGLCGSVGCVQEYDYVDPTQNVDLGGGASNMALQDGFLAGDFGTRRGFDGEATRLEGNSDREYRSTSVNVVREQRGLGAGMVILAVSGTTLDEMATGEHRFSYDEASFSDEAIYVNVCGGDSSSSFDYDQPARNGSVTIEEAPNGLRSVDIQTATPVLDPATGIETGDVETATTSFTFRPQRG